MSFGIRVAPGVRISASRRGLRTAFGTRPSAVSLGSGRSGSGPFSYWAGANAHEGSRPADLTTLASQIRSATRPADIAESARTEAALVAAHAQPHPVAASPLVAPPDAIDGKAVAAELRSQALLG
ncbi:MAG: hypothetical protein M3063_11460, partial [Actinomycetota bacterium]|nr:hypothetical protein [Actinomycetota bacterium]